jgi:hypothetical protein
MGPAGTQFSLVQSLNFQILFSFEESYWLKLVSPLTIFFFSFVCNTSQWCCTSLFYNDFGQTLEKHEQIFAVELMGGLIPSSLMFLKMTRALFYCPLYWPLDFWKWPPVLLSWGPLVLLCNFLEWTRHVKYRKVLC